MKLTFLGTRANIAARTRRHNRHSALLVSYHRQRIMIDCGADWKGRIADIAPDAIFITHAHPDHAWGLAEGVECPVYATAEALAAITDYPVRTRVEIKARTVVELDGGLRLEAFPVVHSLRAPAVGYRIGAGRSEVFYVPDAVDIEERQAALEGVDIFIGDGSSLTRPLVRRRGDHLFGHTTIRAQLGWCGKCGVSRALFTHCGSEIVEGDERAMRAKLRSMASAHGVDADIAYDGMSIVLR